MAYNLIITERADEQIDRLTAYLLNHLKNPDATAHFLDELETIYNRLEENPYQFAESKDEYLFMRGYRDALFMEMTIMSFFVWMGNLYIFLAFFIRWKTTQENCEQRGQSPCSCSGLRKHSTSFRPSSATCGNQRDASCTFLVWQHCFTSP